ncbi:MAG: thioredoxin domain-containing protein [Patescibacteria group bacterium]|jgi:protein-disulfide isomerase
MSDLNPKQLNLFIKLALLVLVIFTILIIVRSFYGSKALKDSEEYLASLTNVAVQTSEPSLTEPITRATDPTLGNADAKNKIVVYSDFQCPYCATAMQVLAQLLKQHPIDLLITWKDFPNPDHPQAQGAAVVARCAAAQNKFWDFHDYLYANQDQLGPSLYPQIVASLKMDLNTFNQCNDNQIGLPLVEENFTEAMGLRLDGTPYLFVNNQKYVGAINVAELEKMLK